jgi:zinc/manganese transport system ATP-binding protein
MSTLSRPHAATPETLAAPAIDMRDAAVVRDGRRIFAGVRLTVVEGEFVAVLGPNGAGKSTLIQAVLGMLPLAAGTVTVLGRVPGQARADVGYLPQRHGFDNSVALRGVDIVRLGLDGTRWGLPLGVSGAARARRREERGRVAEVIDLVGASSYAERAIGELSGGEQQRLLIAQALTRRPRLLMLDEPLDSLDLPNQANVAALVSRICREQGVAVLLVAHDVNPLLGYLDRVMYLAGGRAVTGPVEKVITAPTLTRLYGVPIEVLRARDGRLVVVGTPEAPHIHGPRHDAP